MRASFVTIAKANEADDLEVMNQTKHRTTTMIQRYDRRRNIRKHNASGKLGLLPGTKPVNSAHKWPPLSSHTVLSGTAYRCVQAPSEAAFGEAGMRPNPIVN
ncbi:hypothetical protein GK091_25505 [Spirosoma agri]|uniref:Uncharacterized protein n=1 Tax=Spirosoma agri TaxID=1987381 RepID=A0A6M0IPJ7_9BACT|nr:hypothetical protein [Spirosoma agri]NEU70259.1 hypothetical protein [Spirosoma agri]